MEFNICTQKKKKKLRVAVKIHPTLNPLQFIGSEVIRISLYGKGDREFEIVNEFNEHNIYCLS